MRNAVGIRPCTVCGTCSAVLRYATYCVNSAVSRYSIQYIREGKKEENCGFNLERGNEKTAKRQAITVCYAICSSNRCMRETNRHNEDWPAIPWDFKPILTIYFCFWELYVGSFCHVYIYCMCHHAALCNCLLVASMCDVCGPLHIHASMQYKHNRKKRESTFIILCSRLLRVLYYTLPESNPLHFPYFQPYTLPCIFLQLCGYMAWQNR